MSDVNTWDVDILGVVVGNILPDSEFYTGPFGATDTVLVANLHVVNNGGTNGKINIQLYEHPGEAGESILGVYTVLDVVPGAQPWVGIMLSIPDKPGTVLSFGIKVWGDTEAEPSFGVSELVFGNTAEGTGLTQAEVIVGEAFTCPEDGIALSISAFIKVVDAGTPHDFRAAIYKDSDKSLVAATNEVLGVVHTAKAWETFTFPGSPVLTGGVDYLLVVWGSDEVTDCDIGIEYRPAYSIISSTGGEVYPSFPAVLSDIMVRADRTCSIYCTYLVGS